MFDLLREAQQQSDMLRQRLLEAEARAVALQQDNIGLKQRLGLPTEADQAALAAWTAGSSGGGAEGAHAAGAAAEQLAAPLALPSGEKEDAPAAGGAPTASEAAPPAAEAAGEAVEVAAGAAVSDGGNDDEWEQLHMPEGTASAAGAAAGGGGGKSAARLTRRGIGRP